MIKRNQQLRAVVSIRNLVIGIDTDWRELKSQGKELDALLEQANELFLNNSEAAIHESWLKERGVVTKEVHSLKDIMNKSVQKINNRDSSSLAETWNQYKSHSDMVFSSLQRQYELGNIHLSNHNLKSDWEEIWDKIFEKMLAIQSIAEGSSLQLAMIEEFSPTEMDELTDTILKHMPRNYSMEEAQQYEKEYMEAYDELKRQATQKKNLWDRFLDILAGGQQQSPAEMVMMKRWVNGEKR